MSEEELLLLKYGYLAPIITGLAIIIVGSVHWFWRRRIEAVKTLPIASTPPGLAEAQGYAWSTKADLRNSAGQLCAYVKWTVEFDRRFAKAFANPGSERAWREAYASSPVTQMMIIDHSAAAVIELKNAHLKELKTNTISWEPDVVNNPLLRNLLKEAEKELGPIGSADWVNEYRLREEYIPLGTPCYTLGEFSKDTGTHDLALEEEAQYFFERLQSVDHRIELEEHKEKFELFHQNLALASFDKSSPEPPRRLGQLHVMGAYRSQRFQKLLVYGGHEKSLLNWLYVEMAAVSSGFFMIVNAVFQHRREIWMSIRSLF